MVSFAEFSEICSEIEVPTLLPVCISFSCPMTSFPIDTAISAQAATAAPMPIFHGKSRVTAVFCFVFCFIVPLLLLFGTDTAAVCVMRFSGTVSSQETGVFASCHSASASSFSCDMPPSAFIKSCAFIVSPPLSEICGAFPLSASKSSAHARRSRNALRRFP